MVSLVIASSSLRRTLAPGPLLAEMVPGELSPGAVVGLDTELLTW
jgi:hypothetical protein